MRNAFAQELFELATTDPRLVLLSGDIGNRMFDNYKTAFPSRFYNCGVAEANMMGIAAGLALSGLRPVVYTIVPFITTRCLEQIRVDVCYHRAPVIIVGVGGGLSYASLGATHHSCEDIAHLRVLPEMTVICPGDPTEVRLAFRAALNHQGPVYLRLGKKGEPTVHERPPSFEIGKGIILQDGNDVAIVSTGNMLPIAMECASLLKERNKECRVISLPTVKPLDATLLGGSIRVCRCLVTLEEHSIQGGLGGSIAEWLTDQPQHGTRLLRIGTPDQFMHRVGNQNEARQQWGLEAEQIVPRILQCLNESKESVKS